MPDAVDVAALDLSFISVLKVLPAVAATMRNDGKGKLVVLIKPQFEARRSQIGAKGVVRDPAVHEEVIKRVVDGAAEIGSRTSRTPSPRSRARRRETRSSWRTSRGTNGRCPPPLGPPKRD